MTKQEARCADMAMEMYEYERAREEWMHHEQQIVESLLYLLGKLGIASARI